ncbi:MAG: RNase P subunit p30 family protein [Nanoarchaeota archaeon]
MKTDYVFPNNDEQEFIEIASKLNYGRLIFIYNYGSDIDNVKKRLNKLKTNIELDFALFSLPKYIKKAQRSTKNILVKSSKDNRFVIETNKDLIIFNMEDTGSREFIHHRSSGLNQILCKFANENNVSIAFNFNLILKSDPGSRAKILGRIKQNIKLCRKYKVKTFIASFATDPYEMRDYRDLESFLS